MSVNYLPVVVGVAVVGDRVLRLLFSDGTAGDVDFSAEQWTGVLASLNDPGYFEQVAVDSEAGTIVWPGGIDLAPEPLYEQAKAHPLVAALRARLGDELTDTSRHLRLSKYLSTSTTWSQRSMATTSHRGARHGRRACADLPAGGERAAGLRGHRCRYRAAGPGTWARPHLPDRLGAAAGPARSRADRPPPRAPRRDRQDCRASHASARVHHRRARRRRPAPGRAGGRIACGPAYHDAV